MSFIKIKLAHKISLLVIIIVIISITFSVGIIGYWSINNMTKDIERNLLNVVNATKLSPIIINGLDDPMNEGYKIQGFLEETQSVLEDIDVMVVADKNGLRYGHTVENRVGHGFSAEDHDRAIEYGKTYVSIGPGTLGDSMRAFTPIKNASGDIVGFLMAGSLLTSIVIAKRRIFITILCFIGFGIIIGLIGALYVSKTIKKSLLNFEPEDIARLYLENEGILSTIKEGIIAINQDYEITIINYRAVELLKCKEKDIIGKDIKQVFPQSKLPQVIENEEPIYDYQYALNNIIVNSNNIPLFDKGKLIGGVSSFRDQTEIIKLSEEVTGVQKIVDSLRATTHEFKNKLHVILGYIELDRRNDAIKYILNVNENIENNISHILNLIKEPTIAALLIGKINRGSELKIKVRLNDSSNFENKFNIDINSLVVIIGNLLDNSLENLDFSDKKEKTVDLLLFEDEKSMKLIVVDNGTGIENPDLIFNKGFTTKSSGLGYGLFLTKENVEKYNGSLDIISNLGKGTQVEVNFGRGGKTSD